MTTPAYRMLFRYANRKLYDHTTRGYVCAKDVLALVQSGTDVEVVGVSDKKDYTAQTLSWVLAQALRNQKMQTDNRHMVAALRALKASDSQG